MSLDLLVARAVATAALFERACHDPGPWSVEVNGLRVETFRMRMPTRVIFFTYFPPMCWVTPPTEAWLYCGDILLAVQPIVAPGPGSHVIEWSIGLAQDTDTISV